MRAAEELAELERQRLEALEAQRRRRMQARGQAAGAVPCSIHPGSRGALLGLPAWHSRCSAGLLLHWLDCRERMTRGRMRRGRQQRAQQRPLLGCRPAAMRRGVPSGRGQRSGRGGVRAAAPLETRLRTILSLAAMRRIAVS